MDGLTVENLTVRYSGIVAVNDVSLTAPLGRCTGLIGPNGAGKTTVLNACFGMIPDCSGKVQLLGRSVSRVGPAARARRGMARTFQRMELFDSFTVGENVQMGREAIWVGSNPLRTLYRGRRAQRMLAEARDEALSLCDLTHLGDAPVANLSTGQRRLVEFARVLASPAMILLLDEPSSGLDQAETDRFARVLTAVIEARGVGVLLVEHDMRLVSAVCTRVHVLDFGQKIFEGNMDDARRDPAVRAAYFGDLDVTGEQAAMEVRDA
jgi:ABC-type branched-subunit amino acid transport system ATPase component